jgi:mono/diheme cytochrome c family protein
VLQSSRLGRRGSEAMTVRTPIPSATRGVPGWALGLTLVVFAAGGAYFGTNLSGENPPIGGPPPSAKPLDAHAIILKAGCTTCHAPDLTGAVGPSLHGVKKGPISPNLKQLGTDHPADWANIWIAGTDPSVSDAALRKGMPQFAAAPYKLSADEIAAVVAYLKTLK